MRPVVLMICSALALAGCKREAAPSAPAAASDPIETAKAAVLAKLETPQTAQFGDIITSTLSGAPVVCGFVSWGDAQTGNSGEQPFYVKDGEAVVLSPDTFAEFRQAWGSLCQAL